MTFAGALRRGWIPLVVLAVVGAGGLSVSRVRSASGPETHPYAGTEAVGSARTIPKSVVYEVFGPVGTVADISYFDVNCDPREVHAALLPWSVTLTANVPAVVGNVVAQGDSESIGCRIVIDDQVKAERISNEVNAYTHCLAKGA